MQQILVCGLSLEAKNIVKKQIPDARIEDIKSSDLISTIKQKDLKAIDLIILEKTQYFRHIAEIQHINYPLTGKIIYYSDIEDLESYFKLENVV